MRLITLDLNTDRRCKTCLFFEDHSDTEPPDEVNGYCMNPTGHEEYGGHWTHTESVCALWSRDTDVA